MAADTAYTRQKARGDDRLRILALITARGGSKRVPGKNIRPLGGRPLIEWSIDVARGNADISDVLVSTDDPAIAEVARGAGAQVPWLRPAELATDEATSVDVCLHALDWYESTRGPVDGLMLLQPTSPFRSRETVIRGMALFRDHGRRSVIGLSPALSHPMWCVQVNGDSIRPFIDRGDKSLRSQDLPPAYVVSGAFYLIEPGELRARRSFCNDATLPLMIEEPAECVDIDTEWDWRIAEVLAVSQARSTP
jgi:CMP-N,N'-diacetyllegionaminic acid synthase